MRLVKSLSLVLFYQFFARDLVSEFSNLNRLTVIAYSQFWISVCWQRCVSAVLFNFQGVPRVLRRRSPSPADRVRLMTSAAPRAESPPPWDASPCPSDNSNYRHTASVCQYQFGYELHNHLVMHDLHGCRLSRLSLAGVDAGVDAGADAGVFFIYIAVKNRGGWCWNFFFYINVENDRFRRRVICG